MNELYHFGIPGMKWGIRRFQNPDGSLTEEGKRRYRIDSNGRIVKLTRKQRKLIEKRSKTLAEARKKKLPLRDKPISEMTDKELQKYINRMVNEKQAMILKREISNLNPKQVSAGERLIKKVLNDTVMPAMTNVGRQYLEKLARESLKLNEKQEPTKEQKAQRESQYWQNLSNIENNKANYNKTKALNDAYAKNGDLSIYNGHKKNK